MVVVPRRGDDAEVRLWFLSHNVTVEECELCVLGPSCRFPTPQAAGAPWTSWLLLKSVAGLDDRHDRRSHPQLRERAAHPSGAFLAVDVHEVVALDGCLAAPSSFDLLLRRIASQDYLERARE
jgi:hypothetical protein